MIRCFHIPINILSHSLSLVGPDSPENNTHALSASDIQEYIDAETDRCIVSLLTSYKSGVLHKSKFPYIVWL